MTELNAAIRNIPMPARLARRPVSAKGFPVPFFVSRRDAAGEWDFVNIDPHHMLATVKANKCWICGEVLGRYLAFVIGPMCSINRVSSEPPAHRDCAEYAVRACPFLARPNMRRNLAAAVDPTGSTVPGIMVQHNPGATLIWVTKSYRVENGLFEIGDPVAVAWYAEGRIATRAEIDAAIAKGLPLLHKHAAMQAGGIEALQKQLARAQKLLPAE